MESPDSAAVLGWPRPGPFELGTSGDFLELWREKLCTILANVVALERAADLISEGYFDGHDVLFADSQKELTSSHETARFLIVGYNCFAEENGNEPIDKRLSSVVQGAR